MKSNTKNNLIAGLIALSSLAAGAPAALAQDAGFYAGIGFGQSKVKDFCEGVVGTCDDKDTAWKILGGYQFNKYLGAEIEIGRAHV